VGCALILGEAGLFSNIIGISFTVDKYVLLEII